MSKGSNRRPSSVPKEVYDENWSEIVKYNCDRCDWYGSQPNIVGSQPPYGATCPNCDNIIILSEVNDGD